MPREDLENVFVLSEDLEIFLDKSNQNDNSCKDLSKYRKNPVQIKEIPSLACEEVSNDEEDLSKKEHDYGAASSFDPAKKLVCDDVSSMPSSTLFSLSIMTNQKTQLIVLIKTLNPWKI